MKAIEIARMMQYYELQNYEQGGIYTHEGSDDYMRGYFAMASWSGSLKKDKEYLYLYDVNQPEMAAALDEFKPDAIVVDGLGQKVYLWEIE